MLVYILQLPQGNTCTEKWKYWNLQIHTTPAAVFCDTMKATIIAILFLVDFYMLSESAVTTDQSEAKEWSLWKQVNTELIIIY